MKRKGYSKVTIRNAEQALALLFPSVKCTVAPNGQPEIWVKDNAGYGFALTLGAGKAGVSATIRKFSGGAPVSLSGNKADADWSAFGMTDAVEVSACVFRNDEYAQAHKAWYAIDAAGLRGKHPSELGMESPYVPFQPAS